MVPLSVPQEDRRIVLRSFWLVISLSFATLAFLSAKILGLPVWWCSLGAFVVVASVIILNEHLVRRLYRAWNNKIVRALSNFATAIILRVCLLLVFTGTRLAGRQARPTSASGTLWAKRNIDVNQTTVFPFSSAASAIAAPNGWIRSYLRWAFATQNTWAIFLIPFFCLLRMVSREEQAAFGANIYTLF